MSKNWVPKRIGGVSVPKPIRRAGRGLSRLVNQPLVAALAAPAIAAGAAAAARSPRARSLLSGAVARAKLALHARTEPMAE